jgi:putative peptidoglycan binding protein
VRSLLLLSLVLLALCPLANAQSERLSGVAQTDDGRQLALRASLTFQPGQSVILQIEVQGEGRHEFAGNLRDGKLELWGGTNTGIVGAIGPNSGQLFHDLDLTALGLAYSGVWKTRTAQGERQAWITLAKAAPRATGGIRRAVGPGAPNTDADVRWVQRRLRQLGFSWVDVDGDYGPQVGRALRAFQAMVRGRENVSSRGGWVSVRGNLDHWLHADNAPRWGLTPSRGTGFYSIERLDQRSDDHDYGTSWLSEVLVFAGQRYQRDHRSKRPSAMPILANDVSRDRCRDTPDHEGHETGLSLDVGLPRTDGKRSGTFYTWKTYDRPATEAMLRAFLAHPRVAKIYFQDPVLIRKKLCVSRPRHGDHLHIQLKPPARQGSRP